MKPVERIDNSYSDFLMTCVSLSLLLQYFWFFSHTKVSLTDKLSPSMRDPRHIL